MRRAGPGSLPDPYDAMDVLPRMFASIETTAGNDYSQWGGLGYLDGG
jgi:hypothetical protein